MLVTLGGGFVLLLLSIRWFGRTKKNEGVLETENKVLRDEAKADRRADDVLAEHRDVNDGAERLRRGDF
jgi:hypothetical protein